MKPVNRRGVLRSTGAAAAAFAIRRSLIWGTAPHIEKDPRGEERRYAAGSPYRQPGTY